MSRLRITQSTAGEDRYRIDLEFEGDGGPRQTATAEFDFQMTEQDQADLRWYLEDFLQYPQDPAPAVAARVEGRMVEIGAELFRSVFQVGEDARELWSGLRAKLDDTHVEVITSVEAATAIPWELIRDPRTDTPLALRASAFVRAQPNAAQRPDLPKTEEGSIRILLVICRPGADDDVPFRSVASRLIKGLTEEASATFQLDVLRPPTFERLALVLRRAKAERKPYHVVHFDGHGMYTEVPEPAKIAEWLKRLSSILLTGPRTGKHGFLLFENPGHKDNAQLVDGPTLGKLLVETDVPVLVLNACRSAHAEVETEPEQARDDATANPHAQVRAIGSLAQEVMDAGVAGVVAMRYNVYVVTAAQFVADLYATLVRGQTLGAAVTMGRKQLAAAPDRTIAYDPRPLQDWCVPIVYESAPIALFPKKKADGLKIVIQAGDTTAGRGSLDERLPRPPDAGFFGRDETLLALDRAFDTQSIVLLHAYAGSGKTSTAAEFARWYALTGGVAGPVLFTSFEQYTTLPRMLDRIGEVFGSALERGGTHWLALDDAERRDVALQVLKQVPVLWIWDNVEPIAGFPEGTPSAWTATEQAALADFLRDARPTQAKFLLTSRRDERTWLGDLPSRIKIGPMPMQERVQLARALAEKHGKRITDVKDWRPLLRFTDGNPLTTTVLVGQALRDGLTTKEQIEDFVSKLRAGEAKFDDEASEGRTKSLGASLSYGFEHAFTENERRQLALLHLFQGFVDVDVLKTMGHPEADWCLPVVQGLTREAGIALLDRAAEVGLLTPHGNGYYTIHPAVPWFFKSLFDAYHAEHVACEPNDGPDAEHIRPVSPTRAFVEAMGRLGDYYSVQYEGGNRDVITAIAAEEANLLLTRDLARKNSWWHRVISAMTSLNKLYNQTGRRAEWARLVDEIVPDFVDPTTDGPRLGREEEWSFVTQFRVRLAREKKAWAEAERLQRACADWNRRQAEEVVSRYQDRKELTSVPDDMETDGLEPRSMQAGETPVLRERLNAVVTLLTIADRNCIRSLATSLYELGENQRERKEPDCTVLYEESLDLAEQIGDRVGADCCAYNLGTAYKDIPAIRDLEQAEYWYRRSLDFADKRDRLSQGKTHNQLGAVAFERFEEALVASKPEVELLRHLNAAQESHYLALDLLPDTAVDDLAIAYNALGAINASDGDIDRALPHFRKAISYFERAGNFFDAAGTRFNVALALARFGRVADSRVYAIAARDGFASYGGAAVDCVQQAQQLIEQIELDADQNS